MTLNTDTFLAANADRACTFEDMSNSLYKDAHGFRPRHAEVPFATVGDLYKEIESMTGQVERWVALGMVEEKDANDLDLIAAERDWLTIS